jgi:hypothetical protein
VYWVLKNFSNDKIKPLSDSSILKEWELLQVLTLASCCSKRSQASCWLLQAFASFPAGCSQCLQAPC